MRFDLKNKVVLVSGGANGIGSLICRYALEEGAKHVAILDVDENGINFAQELNEEHGFGKAIFYKCDITNDKLLKRIFDKVKKANGYLDVVVNNAGIMNDSLQMYKKEIAINFTALVTSTLKSLEIMRQDEGGKGGTVINISSAAALLQLPHVPVYFATKSAVLQFSNCIGLDEHYSRTKVRVITVCFGATDTRMVQKKNLETFDQVLEENILPTLAKLSIQSVESAAKGTIDAYKNGKSGSTWLVANNEPAKDITELIKRAYTTFYKDVIAPTSHL